VNQSKRDMQDAELEALYQQAGDVESEASLDRIIHARAEQARREQASPKRLPWLGGLVTASVVVVAIAVVLQQPPPRGSEPETIGPTELREPEAFMAPSAAAPSDQQESRAADRAGRATGNLQSIAGPQAGPASAPAPSALESEAMTRQKLSQLARDTEELAGTVVERYRVIPAEIADDPDRMLTEIRDLLDKGKPGRRANCLLACARAIRITPSRKRSKKPSPSRIDERTSEHEQLFAGALFRGSSGFDLPDT
jgi:hypothetical protein